MPRSISQRLRRLSAELRAARAGALLLSHPPNLFYLSNFTGDNGMLLVGAERAVLFTDPRFKTQAREECSCDRLQIVITRKALLQEAGGYLSARGRSGKVLFEEDRLSVAQLRQARAAAGRRWLWKGSKGLVESLREVKDAEEISRMRDAARIGSGVMEHAMRLVKAGVSEQDLAAEIEYQMRKRGAEGPSFETIVASGQRAALPHGRATPKRLKERELVVLDLGVILRGYCSDLTRTVHVGRASGEVRRWYQAVLEAQQAARETVRAGVKASQVDEAARSVLRGQGLERYFIHSTGHGLGLEVHERPSLGRNQKDLLKAGSVVTIEPGVYLPGRGGIRIEDDVLVLEGGSETLTSASLPPPASSWKSEAPGAAQTSAPSLKTMAKKHTGKGKPGEPAPRADLGEIARVLDFMVEHGLEELEYQRDDLRVRLMRQGTAAVMHSGPPAAPLVTRKNPPANPGPAGAAAASPAESAPAPAENLHIVKSPIVGTFYSSPSPDAPPFVQPGEVVKRGQVLCIVEAMKLMNEIEADQAGEVVRQFPESGQPVEYGQPLFALRPLAEI
jgi:Xaa-Pro aminopeptidase